MTNFEKITKSPEELASFIAEISFLPGVMADRKIAAAALSANVQKHGWTGSGRRIS